MEVDTAEESECCLHETFLELNSTCLARVISGFNSGHYIKQAWCSVPVTRMF